MKEVYVSYTESDKEFAQKFIEKLRSFGLAVVDKWQIIPHDNVELIFDEILFDSEVYISILSSRAGRSSGHILELGRAMQHSQRTGRMRVLPVVTDRYELPFDLSGTIYVKSRDGEVESAAVSAYELIISYQKYLSKRLRESEEIALAVKVNIAEFVDETIADQKKYERMHRYSANIWYCIGYFSLVAGLAATAFWAYLLISANDYAADYRRAISISLLNIIAIAILAALARYAYSLGKSYMAESLKSSDRIHAIQFGRFFLRVYGGRASSGEIREVFQHWNIDRVSTFSSLDTGQVDPNIIGVIAKTVEAIAGKK